MTESLNLEARIDAIEEAYEYFLAYAAQGRAVEQEQLPIRMFLQKAEAALDGLADSARLLVETGELQPPEVQLQYLDIVEQDIHKALAAVRLVLGQQGVSSQLIDNLNASIHLRTLLTDLFLIDETRKGAARQG
jgi:hypothetical protein